jgi:hypothetical protein
MYMDRNDITRISDLPDSGGSRDPGSRGMYNQPNNQYQPLNVHQNPYGIPEPTDTKLPVMRGGGGGGDFGGGSGGFSGEAMQRAPPPMMNRGFPQDTESYQNDEQVVPNHIPAQKLTTDYLREYEDRMSKMNLDHQKEQHRKDLVVSVYDELQTPILIGVLFFLFQVPIINALMFKYLNFLKIYSDDGNLNLYGILFKSILFGLVYFGFIRLTTYI